MDKQEKERKESPRDLPMNCRHWSHSFETYAKKQGTLQQNQKIKVGARIKNGHF
jgi:hypothetical protein